MAQQSDIHSQRLLIVDFGSQYTQLIARRVRECGVYCEIYPFDISAAAVNEFAPPFRKAMSFCLAALKVLRVMKRHELIRVFLL